MDRNRNIGTLKINFLGPWHVSSGRSGNEVTIPTCRNSDGAPCIPAALIRGTFRCHAASMCNSGLISNRLVEEQFGSHFSKCELPAHRRGALIISAANPIEESFENENFYRYHMPSGRKITKRSIELAPPMTLGSLVVGNDETVHLMKELSPRVTAVGALKSRGFGKARLEFLNGCPFS